MLFTLPLGSLNGPALFGGFRFRTLPAIFFTLGSVFIAIFTRVSYWHDVWLLCGK